MRRYTPRGMRCGTRLIGPALRVTAQQGSPMLLRQRLAAAVSGLQQACADGRDPQESMMLRPTLVTVQPVYFSQGYVGYRLKTSWRGSARAALADAGEPGWSCVRREFRIFSRPYGHAVRVMLAAVSKVF